MTSEILVELAKLSAELASPENQFEACVNVKSLNGHPHLRLEARWIFDRKMHAVSSKAFRLHDVVKYGDAVIADAFDDLRSAIRKKANITPSPVREYPPLPPAQEGKN